MVRQAFYLPALNMRSNPVSKGTDRTAGLDSDVQRAIPSREFGNEISEECRKAMEQYVREPNKIPPLEYAFGDDDALGPVSMSGLEPGDMTLESMPLGGSAAGEKRVSLSKTASNQTAGAKTASLHASTAHS